MTPPFSARLLSGWFARLRPRKPAPRPPQTEFQRQMAGIIFWETDTAEPPERTPPLPDRIRQNEGQ